MKIIWSPSAIRHFSSWIHYIARDSVQRAEKERLKILKSVERLKRFPKSGRAVPEFDSSSLREIIKKPVRIIYRLNDQSIEILTLHHSKRELNLELFK